MKSARASKMKWTILSMLVRLGFANMTFEAFRAMLRRPDYADLLCNGDYPALFKKREILAMTDDLPWGAFLIVLIAFLIAPYLSLHGLLLLGLQGVSLGQALGGMLARFL